MKNLEKTTPYKKMMETLSQAESLGKQCEAIRKEIESLMNEKKRFAGMYDKKQITKLGDIKDWTAYRDKIKKITKAVDEKADELSNLLAKSQKFKDDAEQHKKELYQIYFSSAEEKRKDLFSKIDEVLKLNQDLKAYESDCWEPMSLARAGHSTPYVPFLGRMSGQISQNQKGWKEMKARIEQ